MTIVWSSVYGVLVVEIGILVALLVSCISTKWWCFLVETINRHVETTADTILQYSGVKTAIETMNATWIYDWRKKIFNTHIIFWSYVVLMGLLFLSKYLPLLLYS